MSIIRDDLELNTDDNTSTKFSNEVRKAHIKAMKSDSHKLMDKQLLRIKGGKDDAQLPRRILSFIDSDTAEHQQIIKKLRQAAK